MDAQRSKAVTNAFVKLFNDGVIYRDTRLVNWCCALGTVISDIEVDHETVSRQTFLSIPGRVEKVECGVLHKFAYPIAEPSGEIKELVVATTRIETMLGDVALAVHPDDPRYRSLHGGKVFHPLLNTKLPIICDSELVDMEFGTGVVKVTPGHDFNDHACAKRHQLPIVNIFNKDGTLNENCGISNLMNRDRFEVRKDIIFRLQELGHYRGKTIDNEMRIARALEDVENGEILIKPSYHVDEWNRWLGNVQDWCISRQLWWGHQVPAYSLTYEGQEAILLLHLMKANYPTNMIETGFDIIFFWVARMSMLCTYFSGKPPFGKILLHAMIRDAQGRKMSKSLGNVIDPLHVIDGITLEELQQNIYKSNLSKSEIEKSLKNLSQEFPQGIKPCGTDALRFGLVNYTHQVTEAIRSFIIEDLCGTYLEFIKPVLYGNPDTDVETQRITLKVLELCLDSSLRLLHPFMPFITEELWQILIRRSQNEMNLETPESIMISKYPRKEDFEGFRDDKVEDDMKIVLSVIHASRSLRQKINIPQGVHLPFILWADDPILLNGQSPIVKYVADIKKFIKSSEIRVISPDESHDEKISKLLVDSAVGLVTPNLKVGIPMSAIQGIQSKRALSRSEQLQELTKKFEKTTKDLDNLSERIGSIAYLEKVPDKIKDMDRSVNCLTDLF
ncbi:16065_t:CDS:10 [Acaulospora colombiana]|uniref:16065_t:CDS:1 n=1 Tax=Acaulospora colombiana TaxID=27376 RepID=A0ACA9KQW0_9GLOM|nr:16065_t:CDS:10 [Acaulospora colombiana]